MEYTPSTSFFSGQLIVEIVDEVVCSPFIVSIPAFEFVVVAAAAAILVVVVAAAAVLVVVIVVVAVSVEVVEVTVGGIPVEVEVLVGMPVVLMIVATSIEVLVAFVGSEFVTKLSGWETFPMVAASEIYEIKSEIVQEWVTLTL